MRHAPANKLGVHHHVLTGALADIKLLSDMCVRAHRWRHNALLYNRSLLRSLYCVI
jgi:hypothetical protein